jgi:hypothetical protein
MPPGENESLNFGGEQQLDRNHPQSLWINRRKTPLYPVRFARYSWLKTRLPIFEAIWEKSLNLLRNFLTSQLVLDFVW